MAAAEFTHLHLHTDYSLLDGACDVDKLASHVSKIGQKAAAITDHGPASATAISPSRYARC